MLVLILAACQIGPINKLNQNKILKNQDWETPGAPGRCPSSLYGCYTTGLGRHAPSHVGPTWKFTPGNTPDGGGGGMQGGANDKFSPTRSQQSFRKAYDKNCCGKIIYLSVRPYFKLMWQPPHQPYHFRRLCYIATMSPCKNGDPWPILIGEAQTSKSHLLMRPTNDLVVRHSELKALRVKYR